jgi:hypothetical protein
MLDNAKSLSTHAILTPNPLQLIPSATVNVIFTLDQDSARWGFIPLQVQSADPEFGVIYSLNPGSTSGWDFTEVTIEDSHQPPAWSFTYPNTSGINQFAVPGVLEATVTELEPAQIALQIGNLNTSKELKTVSVRLTVSDSQGKSFTSPDPQIVLVPR